MNQFLECRRQLHRPVRRNEQPRHAISHRFGNAADIVRHDRQSMRRRLEINEPEAFDAPVQVDAGHRKNIRAVVNVRRVRRPAGCQKTAPPVPAAPRPRRADVASYVPLLWPPTIQYSMRLRISRRKHLQRLEGEQLTFPRMKPADREHDDLVLRRFRLRRHDRKVGPQRAGSQIDFIRRFRKMAEQQFLGVSAQGADARRASDKLARQPAPMRPAHKLQDFRSVKSQHEAARSEGLVGFLQGLAVRSIEKRYLKDPPPADFRVNVNPLVTWIWVGRSDRRARRPGPAIWPAPEARRRRVSDVYAARLARELGPRLSARAVPGRYPAPGAASPSGP